MKLLLYCFLYLCFCPGNLLSEDFSIFKSKDPYLVAKVPVTWGIQINNDEKFSLLLVSPYEDSRDIFNERIELIVFPVGYSLSKEQLYRESLKEFEKIHGKNNFFVNKNKKTSINGIEALEIKYFFQKDKNRITGKSIFFVKNEIAYILGGMEHESNFKKFEKIFDRVLTSLVIEEKDSEKSSKETVTPNSSDRKLK